MSVVAALLLATVAQPGAIQGSPTAGTNRPDPNPIAADGARRLVRGELDGAGVSDVAVLGDAVVVVDPNQGLMHAYPTARFGQPGRVCAMPRDFSPWRTVSTPTSLRIVSEDERTTFEIARAAPAGWSAEGASNPVACAGRRDFRAATDAAPPIARLGDPLRTKRLSVPNPLDASHPATIVAGVRGQILSARPIGRLSGGRFAFSWKELDQWPLAGAPAPLEGRRLLVNVWVSVFDRRGARLQNIRIKDHELPPGRSRGYSGLSKRAFEFLAVGSDAVGDWLYVVDGREDGQTLRRFRLPPPGQRAPAAVARATATVSLFPGALPEPSQDSEDDQPAATPATGDQRSPAVDDRAWKKLLLERVGAYARPSWRYPAAALTRPCGFAQGAPTNDQCDVTLDDGGHLVPLASGQARLATQTEQRLPARWIGPRHLVGADPATVQTGVPYSYGGSDDPASFEAGRAEHLSSTTARPIGNIRLEIQATGAGDNIAEYPLGIDCSAFVARIFGVRPATTGSMMKATAIGPNGVHPHPVPHLSEIRPGDILVKKGHVVIFTGMVPIGRALLREASLGMEVYEATSRCGRVCRSVYEADFFNGWWIVRMPAIYDRETQRVLAANPHPAPAPPPAAPAPLAAGPAGG